MMQVRIRQQPETRNRWIFGVTLVFLMVFPVFLRPSNAAAPTVSTSGDDGARVAGWIAVNHTNLRRTLAPLEQKTVRTTLYDINGEVTLVIDLPLDGEANPRTAAALEQFFHCRRTGRHKPLASGVLALLADISSHHPGRTIEIISGYRSPPYGAPHSKHFQGHAIDLRVRGVKLSRVRDEVWTSHSGIGVGWYPQQGFIHVDYRPGEKDTSWSAKHEGAKYHYNPWWAERARDRAHR